MTEFESNASQRSEAEFATTCWTRVLACRDDAEHSRAALRELCEIYYSPVAAFIQRARHGADDAADLTNDFFQYLLAGDRLVGVNPQHGRFRNYLLGAVKHFLADAHDRRTAIKRGSVQKTISLDLAMLNSEHDLETHDCWNGADPTAFPSDAFFDRAWAMHVLERALNVLQQEQAAAGKSLQFELLKGALTAAAVSANVATELGVSDGAVKVLIHRLRKRFRQVVKAEIGNTMENPVEIDEEIAYLIQSLCASPQAP